MNSVSYLVTHVPTKMILIQMVHNVTKSSFSKLVTHTLIADVTFSSDVSRLLTALNYYYSSCMV